jgi:hypothetical protein
LARARGGADRPAVPAAAAAERRLARDRSRRGWWNRQNNPEIDLVGADRDPVAGRVHFVGSIKWLENQPFGTREYDTLVRDMLAVPGTGRDTPTVAVSRCGVADGLPLTAHWTPGDLVRAWT